MKNAAAVTPAKTPASLGFSMPAEWERHEATWLGWPHNSSDWPGKMEPVSWVFGEMTRKLATGEIVRILVQSDRHEAKARRVLTRAHANMKNVEFLRFPTDRGWMRDAGPIFVRNKKKEVAVVHFHFNAWARYPNWKNDTRVPERVCKKLGFRMFDARWGGKPFIIEGGGIDVNGCGTLLTTEECYLHPDTQVRNPGLGKDDIEAAMKEYLGVTNILWLGSGVVGDDTHGHVDDICRFVNRDTVVLAQEKNSADVNYKPLAENRERLAGMRLEDGSKINVVALPMPAPLHYGEYRLPASYANFYIGNDAVIVPTFNDPADRVALGILGDLFKDRLVVGIHAVDLVLGFGTLHCLTHEQPAKR